jgi:polyisoprenoid-binding protein YceI
MKALRKILITPILFAALPASAAEWRMLAESEFNFETTFEETVLPGRFEQFDVALVFDPDNPGAGYLQVTVDLEGANMDDPDINAAIAAAEWFHIAEFPQATYESEEIVATASGRYVAKGELDLKGIRREVDVPFTWSASGDGAEMTGAVVLQRTDFDVGSGEWSNGEAIGLNVRLTFTVRFERND